MYMEGLLHIDHIRPCCAYYLSDIQQVKECFHYTNLRLSHALDNSIKAAEDKKLSIYKKTDITSHSPKLPVI